MDLVHIYAMCVSKNRYDPDLSDIKVLFLEPYSKKHFAFFSYLRIDQSLM